MKNLYIFIGLLCLPYTFFGQTNFDIQCPFYNASIQEGDKELRNGKKADFKKAIDHFLNAAKHCPTKTDEAQAKIVHVFDRINKMKVQAERDRTAAQKAEATAKKEREKAEADREIAKQAQAVAEAAKVEAQKAQLIAQEQTMKADSARKKVQDVLDHIYFYKDSFGLAQKGGSFGFIDKDLNHKIEFKYKEALPFDMTGFAKVKRGGIFYLIDTRGTEHKLPTDINQLDSSIKALDLRDENLKEIPKFVFKNTQLKVMLLSGNQFTNLPLEIGNLTSLISLDLKWNRLTILPAEIGNLTQLVDLNLESNQLSSIPAEIGNLTKLTRLDLNRNQLRSLPAEIGNLTKLTSLYSYDTQLVSLPAEIGKLTNLTHLELWHNQLTSLPPEIGNLTNLTNLNLEQNQLKSFPAEIGNLTKLVEAGDLITTSDTPGAAMAAKDPQKAWGTVVGKAITNVDADGYVTVIVQFH